MSISRARANEHISEAKIVFQGAFGEAPKAADRATLATIALMMATGHDEPAPTHDEQKEDDGKGKKDK